MPYSYPEYVPEKIKSLPVDAQKTFVSTFNSALTMYRSERAANQVAWMAVNKKYEQDEKGNWMEK